MLSPPLLAQLVTAAQEQAPLEMCGLLFDQEFQLAPNSAPDPTKEFLLAHHHYLELCAHRIAPWALVHSHPGKSAGLSSVDCLLMDALQVAGVDLAMVVVGMNPVEIRVFKKQGDLYSLQWKWEVGPWLDVPIYYATNL